MIKKILSLFLLLIPCTNYATELCADIQFTIINDSNEPINHPHANNPTDVNSKAIKSEQAKLKKYLSCSSEILLKTYPAVNKANISKIDTNILKSIKNSTVNNKYIAKAIYLDNLRLENVAISGENTPTKQWQLDKKKEWCNINDPHNDQSITIPLNLPSLENGIENLNKGAINYSWRIIEKYNTKQLKNSCDAAIVKFLKRIDAKEKL